MIEKIKRLTITGLMQDEYLMGGLVLKGGNALNLLYKIDDRGSLDIDFSIAGDFTEKQRIRIQSMLDPLLNEQFQKENLLAFDIKFTEKPKQNKVKVWKGYVIEFKIIEFDKYIDLDDDASMAKNRNNSIPLDENHSKKFTVDISSYEYVETSTKGDLDGTILRVYTPEMILLEKLRALCQSIPEYQTIVPTANVKGRARDFYDIWNVSNRFQMDFTTEENKLLLESIFAAKRVPIEFLNLIKEYQDVQEADWMNVIATVEEELQGFDYYFKYTQDIINTLLS